MSESSYIRDCINDCKESMQMYSRLLLISNYREIHECVVHYIRMFRKSLIINGVSEEVESIMDALMCIVDPWLITCEDDYHDASIQYIRSYVKQVYAAVETLRQNLKSGVYEEEYIPLLKLVDYICAVVVLEDNKVSFMCTSDDVEVIAEEFSKKLETVKLEDNDAIDRFNQMCEDMDINFRG